MDRLLSNFKIVVPEKLYLKDPESSQLGKRIVSNSILLIDDIGFEAFTFKKLGTKIGSNESSLYRYFESKHKLLLYLSSWYWAWVEYQLVFETHNIKDPKEKLNKAISIITRQTKEDSNFSHINEVILNKIIINENAKSFMTKEVDIENKEGYFSTYKRVVTRLKEMIAQCNPEYPYATSLASTIVEGAMHQHFLKDHFQLITDCNNKVTPTTFFTHLTNSILSP
jgi:AcrR family transcriptional regulator